MTDMLVNLAFTYRSVVLTEIPTSWRHFTCFLRWLGICGCLRER